MPRWPVYQNAFQALELYLKAYLLMKGAAVDDLRELGEHGKVLIELLSVEILLQFNCKNVAVVSFGKAQNVQFP
jgi:hypothetical protein